MAVYACVVLLLIIMIVFAGISMLRGPNMTQYPGHGTMLGEVAMKGFYEGGDASILSGQWKVTWTQHKPDGSAEPFKVRDRKTGEIIDYPGDFITVKTFGALISADACDQITQRVYFVEGRVSSANTVTAALLEPSRYNRARLSWLPLVAAKN